MINMHFYLHPFPLSNVIQVKQEKEDVESHNHSKDETAERGGATLLKRQA